MQPYPNPNYYNQFQMPYAPPQPVYNRQKAEIVKVNGKGGAEAYILAPNSSVLLLDEQEPIVWLKQTDGAGYPTLTPYTITPYKEPAPVSTDDLAKRIERLEKIVNESFDESTQYNESNAANKTTAPASKRKTGSGTQPNDAE